MISHGIYVKVNYSTKCVVVHDREVLPHTNLIRGGDVRRKFGITPHALEKPEPPSGQTKKCEKADDIGDGGDENR